jgi:hypothetical protein
MSNEDKWFNSSLQISGFVVFTVTSQPNFAITNFVCNNMTPPIVVVEAKMASPDP